MKKWNHFALIVTFATARLTVSAQSSHASASTTLTDNVAVLSSPRYREVHPELLRASIFAAEAEAEAKANRIKRQTAKLMENRAFAGSPRTREEFPELQRPPISAEEALANSRQIEKQLAGMMENAAWVSSPRAREDYAELLRAATSISASQTGKTQPHLTISEKNKTSARND